MQGFVTDIWDSEGRQKLLLTQKHTSGLCTASNKPSLTLVYFDAGLF